MNSTCELGDDAAHALKPYPDYKDSGIEWLGDVPEHWEVVRLRNTSEMRVSNVDKHAKDDEQPVRLCNYVDVYKNDRIRSGMAFMRATATTDEIERFRLQSGDVLITKDSEAWNDIGVPALVEDTQDDIVSGYHLALLRPFPERVDGGYLFRALQSPAVAYQFHVEANGVTRYGLSHSAIRSVWLPLPPLSEQAAIVRFLDHADRRIRRYIRAQQQLIALLEEQKQAIIHQAVTGQVDVRTGKPYQAYKPSGVEWLGDVPEHWAVRRVKTLCSMRSGESITAESIETTGEYPVYGGNGLRGYASSYTHDGAFALIGRQGALCGNVHVARGKFWASEHAVVATLDRGHVLDWFGAILRVMNLNQYSIAAAQPGLSVERVLNLRVSVPPMQEQEGIANHIERDTADIDTALAPARRQIDLLQEYRTSLIADVVTGKFDVREAAARLPDEVEELEPLDEADALIDGEEEPADALATVP